MLSPFVMFSVAFAGGLALPVNADQLGDVPGPDAVCLRSQAEPKLPTSVDVPVHAAAAEILVSWTARTGVWQEGGVVATVTAVWEDGQSTLARAVPGKQAGAVLSSGRQVRPVTLGTDSAGQPVNGALWSVPVGDGGRVVDHLTLTSRNPRYTLCFTSIEVVAEPQAWARPPAEGGYPFVLNGVLDQTVPAPLAVEAPAGGHGFVHVGLDGHLLFEDGVRARFWGINAVGEASIPAHDDADAYATTLASMGFNLIRIHHFDGNPPRGLINPARKGDADLFDTKRLDDLDWFVSRLKAHGIYLYLEVTTEREFTAADGVSNPGGLPNGHKLAPMWEDEWNTAYLHWFERMWGRTNPYTGLRYADDPAVAMVELANEDTLALYWGFGLERLPASHIAALDVRWNAWLREHYPTSEALAAAWAGDVGGGLLTGESLEGGTVRREPLYPAMLDRSPIARRMDLYTFYRDLERNWYLGVEAKARSLGFRVPMVPSINYDQPILQELQRGWDVQDIHVNYDPVRGQTIDAHSGLSFPEEVTRYVVDAVRGKAMMITELSHQYPSPYRAEAPLLWATLASAQDWDVLVWFSYADAGYVQDTSKTPASNDIRGSASTFVQMPIASALFRSGGIPAAVEPYSFVLSTAANERAWIQPETHIRVPAQLPLELLDPTFVLNHLVRTVFDDLTLTPAAPTTAAPTVGSGATTWDVARGTLLIETADTVARVGPADTAGAALQPEGLSVQLGVWSAVAFASLDDQPLPSSHRALLTVCTREWNEGQLSTSDGRELVAAGSGPPRVSYATGTVRFPWSTRPVVVALDRSGKPGEEVRVRRVKGEWEVRLDDVASPWLLVHDATGQK